MRIPKASDLVVTEIREKILFERLPVGERLPSEVELMKQYGLGRVSVREALRVLERDGLVEIRRGATGGVFVRHTDISQVSDALALLLRFRNTTLGEAAEFRLLIEPVMCRRAAVQATDEQREEFRKIAREDPHGEGAADLHRLTAEACGNGVFEMMFRAIHDSHAGHYRYDVLISNQEGGSREHTRIATAIADGDADGAAEAMREHIVRYDEFLKKQQLASEWTMPDSIP